MNTNNTPVASHLKLAVLSTGGWTATRRHKAETQKVNDAHGRTDIATVNVVLTKHSAMIDAGKHRAAAITWHRENTLPAAQDGFRLIPAGQEIAHAAKIREFSELHQACADRFLRDYPAEMASAPQRLNGMYDPKHWPALPKVAETFKLECLYLPCPSGGAWDSWVAEATAAASQDLRERLQSALERIRDNCAGDGKLYASMLDSLRDVAAMVPAYSLPECADLAPVIEQVSDLTCLHIETLRDSKAARELAAKAADRLCKLMPSL